MDGQRSGVGWERIPGQQLPLFLDGGAPALPEPVENGVPAAAAAAAAPTSRYRISVAYGLFVVGCYILLEGYLGQTVGKMATGIKVVSEATGATPGIAAAAVRTVLRLVGGLFSDLVAFICVLASGKRQRLGDMAAHTLVVRAW